jgi:hypothetical protein
MSSQFRPSKGWGLKGAPAALSITFDNFGEAADIEMGWWGDQAIGQHYTAEFVPRLMDALGDIRATYFVEASNATIYPGRLQQWSAAGHEIGVHAWRHEVWQTCSSERRRELLARSMAAMHSIGVYPTGFRPPGGAIADAAWAEFEEAGLLYCSQVGTPGVYAKGQMISLPFEWSAVDVYMIEEVLGFMRVRDGLQEPPFTLDEWRTTLCRSLERTRDTGGQCTIIFHPHFLAKSGAKLAVVEELIQIARHADFWIAPAGEVARFAAAEMGMGNGTQSAITSAESNSASRQPIHERDAL